MSPGGVDVHGRELEHAADGDRDRRERLLDDGGVAYSIVTAAATSADANYNGLNPATWR